MFKKTFFSIGKEFRVKLFFLTFFLILSSFIELIGIGLIPVLITAILGKNNLLKNIYEFTNFEFVLKLLQLEKLEFVILMCSIIVIIFISKNMIIAFLKYSEGKILTQVSYKNAEKLYKFYLSKSYAFHLLNHHTTIARNIVVENQTIKILISNYLNILKEIFVLFGILVLLFITNFIITLFLFVIFSFTALVYYFFIKNKLNNKSKEQLDSRKAQLKYINQALGSIKDIFIFSKEKFMIENFKIKNKIYENNNLFIHFVSGLPRLILETVAIISILFVAIFLVIYENSNESMVTVLSIITLSTIRLIPSYNQITTSLTRLKFVSASANLINKELAEYGKNLKNINNNLDYKEKFLFNKKIKIENVSFSYQETNQTSLKSINEEINFGSVIGIYGPSGAGKSTLINLITGLLEPSSGKITVDGKNIITNKKGWFDNISYVSQDIFLLDDTIRNNIAFGENKDEIDDISVDEAIKISDLEKFIEGKENKINTIVGDRGAMISGGQKQRIGIARAFYRKPRLLILDEATNALDPEVEKKVLKFILNKKKDTTIIIISHKLSNLKDCDKILFLENGRLNMVSTYENYINKKN